VNWKRSLAFGISEVSFLTLKLFGLRKGLRVLLYHAVDSELPHDSYGISINARLFEHHVAALKRMEDVDIVDFNKGCISDTGLKVAITFDDGYKDNLYTAAPILLKNNMPFAVFVTTAFIQNKSPIYLSPEELKELSSLEGVTIGSHGATHIPLGKCDDISLWRELYESKRYLEDITGKPVTAISYPNGSVNQRVRDAAERAGYVIGGSSMFGINDLSCDPLLLYRTEVIASDSQVVLVKKILGAWDWYRWYQKALK